MANSAFSIGDFRARVLGGRGLARQNRFEVEIPSPIRMRSIYDRTASLLVDETTFPSHTITTKPFKIFGPAYQRPVSVDYGGDNLTMRFLLDGDMNVKRFFDNWLDIIVSPEDYTVGYQSDYVSSVKIKQLNEKSQVVYEVMLIEAFPRNINVLPISNSSKGEVHRLEVSFAYRYWTDTKARNPEDIVYIQRTPQGTEPNRAFSDLDGSEII